MVKIFVTLCSLTLPTDCHEMLATSSAYQRLSLFDCADQASLAKWMESHPGKFIKGIRCQFGERNERGA